MPQLKTKVFEAQSAQDLEGMINTFLTENPNIEIDSIEYALTQNIGMVPTPSGVLSGSVEAKPTAFRLHGAILLFTVIVETTSNKKK